MPIGSMPFDNSLSLCHSDFMTKQRIGGWIAADGVAIFLVAVIFIAPTNPSAGLAVMVAAMPVVVVGGLLFWSR